jgi:hypothetical protein
MHACFGAASAQGRVYPALAPGYPTLCWRRGPLEVGWCLAQVVLAQQQELARLVADFEATQARSEAALAALSRGDPAGRLAEAQVAPRACCIRAQKPMLQSVTCGARAATCSMVSRRRHASSVSTDI